MISTSNFSSTLPVWLQNLSLPPSLPLRVRVRVTEEGAPRARDNVLEEAPLILLVPLAGFWILPLCLERHLGQGQRKETPHEGDELVLGCGTNTRGRTRCLEACDGVRGPVGGHARSCPRRLGVRFAEHKHQCPHPWGTGNPGSRQWLCLGQWPHGSPL